MNPSQIRSVYDQLAPRYDRQVGLGERLLLGDLRRVFGSELRGETLEVAVGSGLNLPFYAPAVTSAVGVDLSRGMLDEARRRADSVGRRIELLQMDAERLAFGDDSFDTVAMSLALCTVPNPEAALRELARVCRPGGRVVLLEHGRSPHRAVYALERVWSPFQERMIGCHLTRDTVGTVRRLGFTIDAERSRLFGVFRLLVTRPPSAGTAGATPVAPIG